MAATYGISQSYPGDVGIVNDATVIYHCQFDNSSWVTDDFNDDDVLGPPYDANRTFGHAIAGEYSLEYQQETTDGGPNATIMRYGFSEDTVYFRYYRYYETGFDMDTS